MFSVLSPGIKWQSFLRGMLLVLRSYAIPENTGEVAPTTDQVTWTFFAVIDVRKAIQMHFIYSSVSFFWWTKKDKKQLKCGISLLKLGLSGGHFSRFREVVAHTCHTEWQKGLPFLIKSSVIRGRGVTARLFRTCHSLAGSGKETQCRSAITETKRQTSRVEILDVFHRVNVSRFYDFFRFSQCAGHRLPFAWHKFHVLRGASVSSDAIRFCRELNKPVWLSTEM